MIHPNTQVRWVDAEIGNGVFATARIPRGTITWVKDDLDREFSWEEIQGFDEAHRNVLDRYSYRNASGKYVFCWDNVRYMNHSSRPSCLLTSYGLEIAVRDIECGEELTNDYGCFNIIETFHPRDGEGERPEVRGDDLLRYSEVWDRAILDSLADLLTVEQPLRHMLRGEAWDEVVAAAKGEVPYASTIALLYRG